MSRKSQAEATLAQLTTEQRDTLCYWLERGGRHLEDWEHLQKIFPFSGTVYRGVGFNSKKELEKALAEAKAGTIKFELGSSWTLSRNVAQQFTVQSWEESKWDFPGFIVMTTANGVDVCQFCKHLAILGRLPDYLSFLPKEKEVALPPGSYSVSVL